MRLDHVEVYLLTVSGIGLPRVHGVGVADDYLDLTVLGELLNVLFRWPRLGTRRVRVCRADYAQVNGEIVEVEERVALAGHRPGYEEKFSDDALAGPENTDELAYVRLLVPGGGQKRVQELPCYSGYFLPCQSITSSASSMLSRKNPPENGRIWLDSRNGLWSVCHGVL